MADERTLGKPKAYCQLHLRLPLADCQWLRNEAELYAQPLSMVVRRIIREARLRAEGKPTVAGVQSRSKSVGAAATHIVMQRTAEVSVVGTRGQRKYEPPVIHAVLSTKNLA